MRKTFNVILGIILAVTFTITSLGFTSTPLSSIKLDSGNVNIAIGGTYLLKITLTPSDATNKKLIFSSGNKNVATVDKNGRIKGTGAGTTVVTVSSSVDKKIMAKCFVTVNRMETSYLNQTGLPIVKETTTYKLLAPRTPD